MYRFFYEFLCNLSELERTKGHAGQTSMLACTKPVSYQSMTGIGIGISLENLDFFFVIVVAIIPRL